MKGWLIDSYRAGNKIILWIKTPEQNYRIERDWQSIIYIDETGKKFLSQAKYPYRSVEKKNFLGERKRVYEVVIKDIMSFERIISSFEKEFKHRVMLYNADIPPEQSYLYHKKIAPGQLIEIIDDKIHVCNDDSEIVLTQSIIEFETDKGEICTIDIDNHHIAGNEEQILKEFVAHFSKIDPDIVIMDYAFSKLPFLEEKLSTYRIESPFHRWDKTHIRYKGNKSFYTYGRVILRDFAIRLKGRFLIDRSSVIGHECDVDAIMELCRLTGARFQQVASRSFGAVFQQSLVRLMFEKELLIPYKEKPVDIPISMLDMLRGDSGGHRFDPKTGYHENVAEIDFTSMYPWIIYNKNISADTMLIKKLPLEKVPGLALNISHAYKGLIPQALKPLLDKRMEYKRNPTSINLKRAKGIKHVLVTAYGYARFREFKLGTASSHMAICAYAREILIEAAKIAEEKGFTVVHGVVDSLFLKKKGIAKEEVLSLIRELELLFGMPISYEGLFKWILFLPSINNIHRPLPSTYYGVFTDGNIKARGIELRQRGMPFIVRYYQEKVIESFAKCDSKKEMVKKIIDVARQINAIIKNILQYPKEHLIHRIIISKQDYAHNNIQKQIVHQLAKKGITALPGQTIFYIMGHKGAMLPEDYACNPDLRYYKRILERALFNITQPLGFSLEKIKEYTGTEHQKKLLMYMDANVVESDDNEDDYQGNTLNPFNQMPIYEIKE